MDYQQMSLFDEQGKKQSQLYQGASLANRTALQDCVRHLMMNVTYGLSTGELLTKLSPNGLWLKMYEGYCQVKMDGSFEEYSEILPTWGLMLDGAVFALPMSEQYIPEKGLQLLPTPTATDYKGGAIRKRKEFQMSCLRHYLHFFFHGTDRRTTYPHPAFVEKMMGFPKDWSNLKDMETQ